MLFAFLGIVVVVYRNNLIQGSIAFNATLNSLFSRVIRFQKKNYVNAFVLFVVAFAVRLYYALSLPISYDEAWTFINFTNKGILSSMSYYPAPNNHILHSIFTNICSILPFDSKINLRIPSMVASALSVSVLYIFSVKSFSKKTAFFVSLIFGFLPSVLYYGTLSRGYSLILLCFIVMFFSTLNIIQNKRQSENILSLAIFSTIGLYTMPSFLYPVASLFIYLFLYALVIKKYNLLKNVIKYGIAVIVFTIVLYLPIIVVSGLDSIINNQYVQTKQFKEIVCVIFPTISTTLKYLFYSPLLFGGLLFASFLLFFKNKIDRKLFQYCCFILIMPVVFILIQRVIGFPRTWLYLIIPTLFILSHVIDVLKIKSNTINYFASIILSFLLLIHFNNTIRSKEDFSFEAEKVAKLIMDNNLREIYCNYPLIETNIIYFFITNNYNYNLTYSRFTPVQSDPSLTAKSYKLIISEEELDSMSSLLFYSNKQYNINLYKINK